MSNLDKIWSDGPVEWRLSTGLTPYPEALAYMEERAAKVARR